MKLLINALVKFLSGLIICALLIFLPAGTLNFPNGWLLISILFIPMLALGIALFVKAPKLLQKRLETKEKTTTQSLVVFISALIFIGGFIVAGLDFRFGWTKLSPIVVISSAIIFLGGYILYAEVMRENTYLSRTIKVEENQELISTGLYGLVRHPMYMSSILLFLSLPLVLGSLYSFLIFLLYPVIIGFRIENEEKLLTNSLPGYKEYKQKIKYKIIPFIW